MPEGRGLEIRYSFGDAQQRTVVYSERRIGLFLCLVSLMALALLSLKLPPHLSTAVPKVATQAVPARVNSEILKAETHAELSVADVPAPNSALTAAPTTEARPAASGAESSLVAGTDKKQLGNTGLPTNALNFVDIKPLRIRRNIVTAEGNAKWTLSVGLSNRTDRRLSGTVVATLSGFRSEPLTYKMSRYVEKDLVLSIPLDTVDSQTARIEVHLDDGRVIGQIDYDLSNSQEPAAKSTGREGGNIP